jgi:hypothetical protein
MIPSDSMSDDWSERGSLLSALPHPHSPAGRSFDWTSYGLPHPGSPAGRNFDWWVFDLPHPGSPAGRTFTWSLEFSAHELSEVGPGQGEEFEQQLGAVEKTLAGESDTLREGLPDKSLQILYDRWVDPTKGAYGDAAATPGVFTLLRKLRIPIEWFDPQLQQRLHPSEGSEIEPSVADAVWQYGTPEEKARLLENIKTLSARVYEAVGKSIHEQWAAAALAGKQKELVAKWRARILQHVARFTSVGVGEGEPAETPRKSAKSPADEKTWIEVQLLDEKGKPVPNAKYQLELSDGSTRTGNLDPQGGARIDDIDPGDCQVSFPEIDANEWQPA